MADIRPFRGVRFDAEKVPLSRALCPPYDAILPEEARRLRRDAHNAIHLELPLGEGKAKYRRAASIWKKWTSQGVLRGDAAPALYVCEQAFRINGREYRRRGFLAAMGVSAGAAKYVVRHERTLAKPKTDRLNLLRAAHVNISPIFGLVADSSGSARRFIARACRRPEDASGRMGGGIFCRLWKVDDAKAIDVLRRALKTERVLIADGHHRYEVSRVFYAADRSPGAATVLIYLCPEKDAGLVVLPTHRIVSERAVAVRARALCRVARCSSRAAMLSALARAANPYAFGLFDGAYWLAAPKSANGCKSGLCVEWLKENLLSDVAPDRIGYTPQAPRAARLARETGGIALFVKPMKVAQIRRAVAAVGLLPQKSTYFYPKIATGLVFKPL